MNNLRALNIELRVTFVCGSSTNKYTRRKRKRKTKMKKKKMKMKMK